jgi:hypothetical protein
VSLSSRNEISYSFEGIVELVTCDDVDYDVFVISETIATIPPVEPGDAARWPYRLGGRAHCAPHVGCSGY